MKFLGSSKREEKIKRTQREKGQMAVESILLLVLFVGVFSMISRYFKSNETITRLVSEPWVKLSSLLQNGVWDSNNSFDSHPLQQKRNRSIQGDP